MEGEICEGCTADGKNWVQKVEITDNVLLIVLGNRTNSSFTILLQLYSMHLFA